MAYKWPNHDPDEVVDYSIDWKRFIHRNDEDDITTVTWFVSDNDVKNFEMASYRSFNNTSGELMLIQPTNTATVATARFGSGVVGKRYTVKCRVTVNSGQTYEREVYLTVREK